MSLPVDSLSRDPGRDMGLLEVEENCAQIGASIGPLADDGGVVFSLSFGCVRLVYAERSLLDLLILPNMADRLVLDLLFFGLLLSAFTGDLDLDRVSSFLPPYATFSCGLEGDAGGDCTFDCRSPSTLDLEAWGWSAGSNGTDCVLV